MKLLQRVKVPNGSTRQLPDRTVSKWQAITKVTPHLNEPPYTRPVRWVVKGSLLSF